MPLKYVDEEVWEIRPEYLVAENIPPELETYQFIDLLLMVTAAEMALKTPRACRRLSKRKLRSARDREKFQEALGFRDGGRYIQRTLAERFGCCWSVPLREFFDRAEELGVPGPELASDCRFQHWMKHTFQVMGHLVLLPWFTSVEWTDARARGAYAATRSISRCAVSLHRMSPTLLWMLSTYLDPLYISPFLSSIMLRAERGKSALWPRGRVDAIPYWMFLPDAGLGFGAD